MNDLPNSLAATAVVPEPMKGSNTVCAVVELIHLSANFQGKRGWVRIF